MNRILLAILLFLAAVPVSARAAGQQIVYRNFIWGVSKEDVRKYETAAFYKEEGDSLYFLYQPDFFRRLIRYDFKDDKLVGVRHEVVELNLPNSSRIVDMAYEEQKNLTDLFGEPSAKDFFWKNRRYEKHPDYWGRALYSRDLRIRITWLPPGAKVVMEAFYDGMQYQIYYTIEQLAKEAAPANAIDLTAPAAPSADTPSANPQTKP